MRTAIVLIAVLGAGVLAFGTRVGHPMLVSVLTGTAFAQAEAAVVADPLVIGYRGDPAKAHGLPFEDVTVRTDLGPAPAWLIPGLDLAGAETLPVLATLDAPLFLSHGSADRIVPVAISHRLLGQRTGATTFVQSDGDHLQTRDRLPQVFDEALSRLAADVAVADARP